MPRGRRIFFKQKTAYEIGTGNWSSDVCSSDLHTDFYDLTLAQTLQENGEVLDAGYSTITELRETEHLFLLHCGRQQWYFVNKAGFTKGTPDEFRAFISERIGG